MKTNCLLLVAMLGYSGCDEAGRKPAPLQPRLSVPAAASCPPAPPCPPPSCQFDCEARACADRCAACFGLVGVVQERVRIKDNTRRRHD